MLSLKASLNSNHLVSERLKRHYEETFAKHGATSKGVDWGADQDVFLRYDKMLAVAEGELLNGATSLLDVGCGYGGLLAYLQHKGSALKYKGIDVAENMIDYARQKFPAHEFKVADVLNISSTQQFDYVVCNGILTQKLSTSIPEMDQFANALIRKCFSMARKGVAFNVMTTKVNFMADNLYYRNPGEMLQWCLSEITPSVKIDQSYRLYEYTVYLYPDQRK